MTVRWWWLRHAPVAGTAITGRLDVACDTGDEAAFARLAALLPREAVLIESGLRRCRQTAQALRHAGLPLPPPLVEPDLVEQDFGAWQGRSWGEVDAADFWRAPATGVPPGGESFAQVVPRVGAAVQRLSAAHEGRDIIAVAHAGSIMAALALALDVAPAVALRFAIAPLSVTCLDLTGGGWRVGWVNRLAEAGR